MTLEPPTQLPATTAMPSPWITSTIRGYLLRPHAVREVLGARLRPALQDQHAGRDDTAPEAARPSCCATQLMVLPPDSEVSPIDPAVTVEPGDSVGDLPRTIAAPVRMQGGDDLADEDAALLPDRIW